MRFQNDYFLEDYHTIQCLSHDCLIITYDTYLHQSLEKYLTGEVNIILRGNDISNRVDVESDIEYFNKGWYLLRNAYITNIFNFGNGISYTIRWNITETELSIHLKRKLRIKNLLMEKHNVHENV